jgi:hypothetical protein
MCSALVNVRFAPNSDRKSGHAQIVMSALHPKADMCGANRHVCFGPVADIDGGCAGAFNSVTWLGKDC